VYALIRVLVAQDFLFASIFQKNGRMRKTSKWLTGGLTSFHLSEFSVSTVSAPDYLQSDITFISRTQRLRVCVIAFAYSACLAWTESCIDMDYHIGDVHTAIVGELRSRRRALALINLAADREIELLFSLQERVSEHIAAIDEACAVLAELDWYSSRY
jgi:hypothetical protein